MRILPLLAVMGCFLFSCKNTQNEKIVLTVFHAGSLSVPFKQIEAEFEQSHPHIDVVLEAAGSIACARKITDLHRDCDVMASSDFTVIDKFLVPDYTDASIKFATNELVLAYVPDSKYATELDASNWYRVLFREDVIYGRSDPNSDPCGYRSLLLFQLAEKYYGIDSLAVKLSGKNTDFIRPKESDLIALLQSGNLDYAFEYKSVAVSMGLEYLIFPDSINMRNPGLDEFYKQSSIEINGKKPDEKLNRYGASIVYGICKLKQAPQPKEAQQFMDFVLSEKGRKIMESNGLGTIRQ